MKLKLDKIKIYPTILKKKGDKKIQFFILSSLKF